ncbi:MAG: cytochrome c [Micrococcaceae bacterium]
MKALSQYRRHPLAAVALLFLSLLITGSIYGTFKATNSAKADDASTADVESGKKLFQANCATCHGINAQGTEHGPSLIGVGAAAVDFQVGSGRMPMQLNGPQAPYKPAAMTDEQTAQLAAYVASLGAGPAIPDPKYLDAKGDAALGGEIFRTNCAMCHNAVGAGGALTRGKFAPDIYPDPQKIYEAMLTGPQNMPVFNDSNITPEQKRDVITYLTTVENQNSPGGAKLGSLGPVSEGLFIWTAGLAIIIGFTIWLTSKSS